MPHGSHIYAKAYDMAKSTMCAYSQSDNQLLHRKCVLRCCSKCPSINITDQEKYDKHPNPSPSKNSNLSYDCTMYKTWRDYVNQPENLSQV